MKVADGLPTVHYELNISFDYIGEIGEFEPDGSRAEAWERLLADSEGWKAFLASLGAIDPKRVLDMGARLDCVGEEPGQRDISPAYNHECNELIGK